MKRVTKETDVSVRINLDGSGEADSSTGIPFLDHMLDVSLSFRYLQLSASVILLFRPTSLDLCGNM